MGWETTKRRSVLAIGIVAFVRVAAGTLDPPDPPAPTMVTLQQIYDKQSGPVAKTGQSSCWDFLGNPIACSAGCVVGGATGQDGALMKGAAVAPRFTSNPDGTVKDHLTGLIWLKNANCLGEQDWTSAMSFAQTLATGSCGLSDGSAPGAWRLPNVNEQLSLVDWQTGIPAGHPFIDVRPVYWSSTPFNSSQFVWTVVLSSGQTSIAGRTSFGFAWPVRGGR